MCVWGWAPRFECVPAQKTQVLTFSSSSRLTFLWTSEMSMSTTPVAQTEEEHDEGKYKIHVYIFICTSEDGQAGSNLFVCFLSRKHNTYRHNTCRHNTNCLVCIQDKYRTRKAGPPTVWLMKKRSEGRQPRNSTFCHYMLAAKAIKSGLCGVM